MCLLCTGPSAQYTHSGSTHIVHSASTHGISPLGFKYRDWHCQSGMTLQIIQIAKEV